LLSELLRSTDVEVLADACKACDSELAGDYLHYMAEGMPGELWIKLCKLLEHPNYDVVWPAFRFSVILPSLGIMRF